MVSGDVSTDFSCSLSFSSPSGPDHPAQTSWPGGTTPSADAAASIHRTSSSELPSQLSPGERVLRRASSHGSAPALEEEGAACRPQRPRDLVMAPLRVLELYSGIGGMHCGLSESGVSAKVVAAVDVNTIANEVYKHNFPDTPLWPKSIEGVSVSELDSLSFDMILMSPPCQPFTRIGLQGDVSDPRAKSFLYVLEILPRLKKTPSYILLENVKGFETSEARLTLIRTLESCGYIYQEFLLSPPCLGIPNSRLRYFLIAKLQAERFAFQANNKILEDFPCTDGSDSGCSSSSLRLERNLQACVDENSPGNHEQCPEGAILYKLETAEQLERKMNQDNDPSVQMLQDFLEENVEISQYLLPPKSLLRYAFILDIVKPTCRRSTCFTKGYGHYVEGTGSIIQTATDVEISSAYKSLESLSDEEKLAKLSTLKLRYFTPREIANLHGFPASFGFPEQITTKQRYRLLGNSLNVRVVAKLIALMLQSPPKKHSEHNLTS